MSRAEYRRDAREASKTRTYTLKQLSDIKAAARAEGYDAGYAAAKEDAFREDTNKAFTLLFSLPVRVIHYHFKDLIKLSVDGRSREERFSEYLLNDYLDVDEGRISLDECKDLLHKETGIEILYD